MTAKESVACPRCAGKGDVSAERIQELLALSHPVQELKPGKCKYCGGEASVPSIVAELVPLHDSNATPSVPPLASREQFLEVLDRLERASYSAYRDDAWASAGCLLLAAEFDRGDLPAELWRRAQPFLFANSLGRLLAAEIAMGVLSVPEAIKTAFRHELPRAADLPSNPRGFGDTTPLELLSHAAMWLRPATYLDVAMLFLHHVAHVTDASVRNMIVAHLLVALAKTCPERALLHDDTWRTLLTNLPLSENIEGTSWSPRVFVLRSLCDDVLPQTPHKTVSSVLPLLVRASEADDEIGAYLEYVIGPLLRFAVTHLDDAGIDEVFTLLIERIRRLDHEYLPYSAGDLARSLATTGAASESRLRTLVRTVAAAADKSCWLGVGKDLSFALGAVGNQPWAWKLFQDVVTTICTSSSENARSSGINELGQGLAQSFPPWKTRALFLLMDVAKSLAQGSERCETFYWLSDAIFQQWQDPLFPELYARLLAASAEASAESGRAFSWLGSLNIPLRQEAEPAYRTAIASYFDTALATIRELPAAAHVAASVHLATVFGWEIRGDVCELLFPAFLSFLDALPHGDALRTKALARAVSCLCFQNRPFDQKGIVAIAHRLGASDTGPNKCSAIRSLTTACDLERRDGMRRMLDAPEVVLGIAKAIAAIGSVCDYQGVDGEGKEISGASLAAGLSRVFDEFTAAIPSVDVAEYEAIFAGTRTLPGSVFQNVDSNGKVTHRYVPRHIVQAALLRRIGPIGDDEWRLSFLDTVLSDLKAEGKPDHSRSVVFAILEALGSVEVGAWHKAALAKILGFLMWEPEGNHSALKRGIIIQLVRTGDLADAASMAREISDPTSRSQALADVAAGMAAVMPDEAVGLLEEIVSPTIRSQLAVTLAESLPAGAERLWVLLETTAHDPERLQDVAVRLLSRDADTDMDTLLAVLGWSPSQLPGHQDLFEVVLDDLTAAECITAKKRDRVLGKLTAADRAAVDADARAAVLAAMVRLGHVDAEEVADFKPQAT